MQETWVQSLFGKIPHAAKQLSLRATTIEAMFQSLCSAPREVTAMRSHSTATTEEMCWPQPEQSPRSNHDPAQPKVKRIIYVKKYEWDHTIWNFWCMPTYLMLFFLLLSLHIYKQCMVIILNFFYFYVNFAYCTYYLQCVFLCSTLFNTNL